jgi:hypothetical protein
VQFNDIPVDWWCKERVGASDDEKMFLMGMVMADRNIQTIESVFIPLHRHGCISLLVGDGLEQPVSNAPEKDDIQIWLSLEGRLDGT